MSKLKKKGTAAVKRDAEGREKEQNHLDRIVLESAACRKLFSWASPKETADDREIREEQRLRWNFDFETETPLPGRYQWVSTREASNGNGQAARAAEVQPSPATPTTPCSATEHD